MRRSADRRRSLKSPRRAGPYRPCLLCLEDRLLLSIFTVNRLRDLGQGSGSAGDLRYCISNAANGDDITFSVTGTIDLTRPLPTLSHNLTITGPGADSLTVERGSAAVFRIFSVASGAVVGMSGLTIDNGSEVQGGGIDNAGTLTVSGSTLSGNSAAGSGNVSGDGGAIYNAGTLTVSGSTLSGNSATGSPSFGPTGIGGGIYNAGTLTVSGSILSGNSAGGSDISSGAGSGGAIANAGTLTVSGSTLSGNQARGGGSGGGISNAGPLTITASTFSGNSASDGGAISSAPYVNVGTMLVSDSTFSSNSATSGGAIYFDTNNRSNTFAVSDSTFAGNSVASNSGGGSGGGIYNGSGTLGGVGSLTVTGSTFSGNSATGSGGFGGGGRGGGIYNAGMLSVSNSTFSSNSATFSGSSGNANGGGIYGAGMVDLTSSTLAGNSTSGNGGGLYVAGTVRPRNTILAGNTAARGPDFFGRIASQGHNLIQHPDSNGSGFDSSDLLTLDPLLGPLQDNGGPTFTMALLPGSPAIDAGDNTGAPMWDQRGPGFARIVNGTIDIGAFEVQNSQAASFQVTASAKVVAGTPFSVTVTALDINGQVAAGYTGTVTFSTSDPDPGIVLPADYTFTLADGGVHTFTDTGLGETTLITRGYQALTFTDTADGSILGSATVKVKHLRRHNGSPGVPAGHDLAAADRFFAALVAEDLGGWAPSRHHGHRQGE